MVLDQSLKFSFLLQKRPILLAIRIPNAPTVAAPFLLAIVDRGIAHQPCDIVSLFFVVTSFVTSVIYSQHATQNGCTSKVVYSKVGATLVLIFQERETLALAGFLVSDQVDVDGLSILREDGDNVTLGDVEWKSANVDVGSIAVVCMP